MPLAVTLCSAAAKCSLPVRAFILNTDLSDKTKRNIETACSNSNCPPALQWVDADRNYLRDQPVGLQHLSQATYLRLGMGRMLPADVTRVIYLDSDVLVVKDLLPLYETALDGKVVGAVRDFMTPVAGQHNALAYCLAETGILPDHPMFNAGILLIDVVAYREQEIEAKCLAFLDRWRDEIKSADQDALNAVLSDNWKQLDYQWNVQMGGWQAFKQSPVLGESERQQVREAVPSILHFSGSGKPWNSGLRSPHCQVYIEHVNQTGWYGQTGFRYWQARRMAMCVRTAAVNKFSSFMANRKRNSQTEQAV